MSVIDPLCRCRWPAPALVSPMTCPLILRPAPLGSRFCTWEAKPLAQCHPDGKWHTVPWDQKKVSGQPPPKALPRRGLRSVLHAMGWPRHRPRLTGKKAEAPGTRTFAYGDTAGEGRCRHCPGPRRTTQHCCRLNCGGVLTPRTSHCDLFGDGSLQR